MNYDILEYYLLIFNLNIITLLLLLKIILYLMYFYIFLNKQKNLFQHNMPYIQWKIFQNQFFLVEYMFIFITVIYF